MKLGGSKTFLPGGRLKAEKITHELIESQRIIDKPCWATPDRSLHLSVPWFSPLQSVPPESPLLVVTLHLRRAVVSGRSSGA